MDDKIYFRIKRIIKERGHKFNFNDFSVSKINGELVIDKWPDKLGEEPTEKELEQVTDEEIAEEEKKRKVNFKMDVFEDLSDVEEPEHGTLVFKNAPLVKDRGLFIYVNDKWIKV